MGTAKDLVDRQHDMLRRRDLVGIADLYMASGYFSMGGARVSPMELPAVMQGYLAAFPDADNEVTDWIETPTGIAVQQVITATHTGPWMTPLGELAPTGKFLRWQAVEFVRVRDGRIASWCSYFDQLSVLLGLSMSVSITAAPDRAGSPVLDLERGGSITAPPPCRRRLGISIINPGIRL